jgi:hypothetical protein
MYIGPWQEFKLAKILQIKEKLDKEAEEEDRLPYREEPAVGSKKLASKLPPAKAFSVGGKLAPL